MNKILIFTGAGLSAESGISTFRDNEDGLWTKYNPDIVCNIHVFKKNRNLVFDFYNERRIGLPSLSPNKAHLGIAEIQKKYGKDNVKIYTQNIDDFLERAGCEDVVHVHCKFTDMTCLNCEHTWDVGYSPYELNMPCLRCGSLEDVKPGVVFFGEPAPKYAEMFSTFGKSRNDIIIVIGTSGEVVPLKYIAGNRYSPNKSYTILNNKEYDRGGHIDTRLFDVCMFKPASEAIDRIQEMVERINNANLKENSVQT